LVEGWVSLLRRRGRRRGAFASTDGLKAALQAFIDQTNAERRPFVWTKTADEILSRVKHSCQRTWNSDP
jgi:hypothetical protein